MGEKTLCERISKGALKKDELGKYIRLVDQPAYLCEKCGRVANEKKLLCRPLRFKDKESA